MTAMVEIEMKTPQEAAAERYMNRKGYAGIQPFEQDKIEGSPCWYFYYHLPEGDLELEVYFDFRVDDWVYTVSAFTQRA